MQRLYRQVLMERGGNDDLDTWPDLVIEPDDVAVAVPVMASEPTMVGRTATSPCSRYAGRSTSTHGDCRARPRSLHRENRLVGRVGERGTVHAERLYLVAGLAVDRELAQDLAGKTRELESVPSPIEDGDLGMFRQPAEHELAVGGHVVEAGLGVEFRADRAGDVPLQEAAQVFAHALVGLEGPGVRGHHVAADILSGFGGGLAVYGDPVEGSVGAAVPDPDRKPLRGELFEGRRPEIR